MCTWYKFLQDLFLVYVKKYQKGVCLCIPELLTSTNDRICEKDYDPFQSNKGTSTYNTVHTINIIFYSMYFPRRNERATVCFNAHAL